MVKPFPTEILERIIFYYFKRDELLHTPEDDFTLITPTRGSTSLLLVSRAFRLLVLPSLFYSISITQPHHWELLFRSGSGLGLMAGDGEEAKLRRSWVREVRIDLNIQIPIALSSDGLYLSPDSCRDSSPFPFSLWHPSPALVSFPSLHLPSNNGKATPPPRFFPNLNRVVLLLPSSPIPSHPPPWPPHLLERLTQRHLQQYRKEKNDPSARFPRGLGYGRMTDSKRLETFFTSKLDDERKGEVDRFFSVSDPKDVWIPVEGGGRGDTSIIKLLPEHKFWKDRDLVKHLVLLDPPSSSPTSSSASVFPPLIDPSGTFFTPLHRLVLSLATFDDLDSMVSNVRFVAFPSDPRFRRGLWELWANGMGLIGWFDEMRDDEDQETVMMKVVKGKNWAWVEEDGREVGFEEGMSLVKEQE